MNKEIDAFENFKFEIGDMVCHIVGSEHMLVVERALVQTTAGIYRIYWMSAPGCAVQAEEAELSLWQRPVRI